MPTQDDVRNDERYKLIHNHGFVGLVETMGSDQSVEEAARVSYGKGTRKVGETRSLIRYLVSHRHTSPLEMCEVKFHIKLPIFVMRQLVRHRTASLNEYSGRYSEMVDEFYVPAVEDIKPQSTKNKQGRDGLFVEGAVCPAEGGPHYVTEGFIKNRIQYANKESYEAYKELLDEKNLARELARTVLPVANYTECYWKIDLKNFMHFLSLRLDEHAQKEIRDFAWAMFHLAEPHFPLIFEAWMDYSFRAVTLSVMEQTLLGYMIIGEDDWDEAVANLPKGLQMGKRELEEFRNKLDAMWPSAEMFLMVKHKLAKQASDRYNKEHPLMNDEKES